MSRLEDRLVREQLRQLRRAERSPVAELRAPDRQAVLASLAHLSQIGLLVLAYLGYVYTIKPVYDKALLDKQIQERSKELAKREGMVARLTAEISALESAKREAEDKIYSEKRISSNARSVAQAAEEKWAYQYAELRAELISRFISVSFGTCVSSKRLQIRVSESFTKCAISEALPKSYVDSLSEKDRKRLARLLRRVGPRIDAVEGQYNQKTVAALEVTRLNELQHKACLESAEKEPNEITKISLRYECDKKGIGIRSEDWKATYRLMTSEQSEIGDILEGVRSEFLDASDW